MPLRRSDFQCRQGLRPRSRGRGKGRVGSGEGIVLRVQVRRIAKDAQAASFRDAQAQAVTGPRQRTEKRIQLMVSVRPPPGDAQAEIDFAAGHQSIHDATFPAQAGYSTSMVIWSLV